MATWICAHGCVRSAGSTPGGGIALPWGFLREEGWRVNRKKVQRLWREEGFRVPQRRSKRRRLGVSGTPLWCLRAQRPCGVWALDFQFDTTTDGGRTFKLLHVVDEYTK